MLRPPRALRERRKTRSRLFRLWSLLVLASIWRWHTFSRAVGRGTVATDFKGIRQLQVIVLTLNRTDSLRILLESLERSHYFGARVNLHIRLDRNDAGEIETSTLELAQQFDFSHGEKTVHTSASANGLANAWFKAWLQRGILQLLTSLRTKMGI